MPDKTTDATAERWSGRTMEEEIIRRWGEGETINAISQGMGLNPNTVCGKVRRLRASGVVESRGSPIKRGDARPAPLPKRHTKAKRGAPPKNAPSFLPALAVLSEPLPDLPAASTLVPTNEPDLVAFQLEAEAAPAPRLARFRNRTCEFITQMRGEGTGEVRKCDEPTEGHLSYCPEHVARCVEPRRRTPLAYDPALIPHPGPYSVVVR